MIDRWRGRATGLAVALAAVAAALIGSVGAGVASTDGHPTLTVSRASDGSVLARVSLPDRQFALEYRNSLYRSLAEERFVVADDGRLRLRSLAADELAVLEEYYAIDTPATRAAPSDRRAWIAEPATRVALDELALAATDLGRRTLIVPGSEPVELFELVDGDPTVVLEVDP